MTVILIHSTRSTRMYCEITSLRYIQPFLITEWHLPNCWINYKRFFLFSWLWSACHQQFDEVSKAFLGFFIARAVVNVIKFPFSTKNPLNTFFLFLPKTLAMWSVIRYHQLLRSGISWKINKHIVELWQSSISDSDSDKTSTVSLCFYENDDRLGCMNVDTVVAQSDTKWHDLLGTSDSELEEFKVDDKLLGDGSDEDDSLLVIYQEDPNV